MALTRKGTDESGVAAPVAAPSLWATYLAPLFGKNAADAVARAEAAKAADPFKDDFDPFADQPGDVGYIDPNASLPPMEPMPAHIVAAAPSLAHANPLLFSPRPVLDEPVKPRDDFFDRLDALTRFISSKAVPSKDNLYPFRLIQAAQKVDAEIRKCFPDDNAFSKLTKKQQADFSQLLLMTHTVISDYPLSCKNLDPVCSYNATLKQLAHLAKRVQGSCSPGKIIGGIVISLIGVIGMGLAIGLGFVSAGALSLPSFGLFGVSAKLVASGFIAGGVIVSYIGRRKELADAVEKMVDQVSVERKI
jgi:hypothetical protein